MNISALLQYVNTAHMTTFEFVGRYTDGEQGAFAIRDQQGKRYVLKWQPNIGRLHNLQNAKTVMVIS